jgi:hypothetical protein
MAKANADAQRQHAKSELDDTETAASKLKQQ